jgi:hypothetical protein
MRVIAVSCALVAAAVLAGAAAAQTNPPAPSGSTGAQTGAPNDTTTGQADRGRPTTNVRRQPRAQDVPAGANEGAPIRSPEDQEIDRKLRICRGC